MSQVKDLNNSYGKIPPINSSQKISDKSNSRSFYVDFN